jgi:hypothetical protein
MAQSAFIECPHCGKSVDVNQVLYDKLKGQLNQEYHDLLLIEKKKHEEEAAKLRQLREQVDEDRRKMEEQSTEGVKNRLKAQKESLEKELRTKIEEEEQEKFKSLQDELNEKSSKLKEFNQAKAEIERLKREKNELREAIEAESQLALNEKIQEEKDKIRKSEQERNELIIKELQKKLEDQKKLTEEMQRKQEQGSMQLQGEVQELAIEEWLKVNYPLDTIQEIRKGATGADCIQVVNTHDRKNCGAIYYESKRAKNFAGDWIEKFKTDMRSKGIAAGILVSQVYPRGYERMAMIDGIWVCSYEEFKGLSAVIRQSVIDISEMAASQENKGDKMVMLYDFLTGNEFKAQVEAIVEGFTQLRSDLEKEKNAMNNIWKSREKQIEKVLLNTTHMYASIKGIGGKAIGTVRALELGNGTDE